MEQEKEANTFGITKKKALYLSTGLFSVKIKF